jgi:L-amino acid N-acyltransferase YncA
MTPTGPPDGPPFLPRPATDVPFPPGPATAAPRLPGPAPAAVSPAQYLIRGATEGDLDVIAEFEIEIAKVSFSDDAIVDPALHRRRVSGSLSKPGEVMLVAVAAGTLVGWAWLSPRTNSLTGARYGNFRSLAVADIPDRSHVGELLLAAVLQAAADAGLAQLTGKVHARNLGMRALYRKFGFEAAHLTMEIRLPPGGGQASS